MEGKAIRILPGPRLSAEAGRKKVPGSPPSVHLLVLRSTVHSRVGEGVSVSQVALLLGAQMLRQLRTGADGPFGASLLFPPASQSPGPVCCAPGWIL